MTMTNRDLCRVNRDEEKVTLLDKISDKIKQAYPLEVKRLLRKSLYMPHQGEKEIARRKKQIDKGIIR